MAIEIVDLFVTMFHEINILFCYYYFYYYCVLPNLCNSGTK